MIGDFGGFLQADLRCSDFTLGYESVLAWAPDGLAACDLPLATVDAAVAARASRSRRIGTKYNAGRRAGVTYPGAPSQACARTRSAHSPVLRLWTSSCGPSDPSSSKGRTIDLRTRCSSVATARLTSRARVLLAPSGSRQAPAERSLCLRAANEGNQSLCLSRELNGWLWLSPASRWMLCGAT
jgi:hypothetical protein